MLRREARSLVAGLGFARASGELRFPRARARSAVALQTEEEDGLHIASATGGKYQRSHCLLLERAEMYINRSRREFQIC
jgi:hypothetical protein